MQHSMHITDSYRASRAHSRGRSASLRAASALWVDALVLVVAGVLAIIFATAEAVPAFRLSSNSLDHGRYEQVETAEILHWQPVERAQPMSVDLIPQLLVYSFDDVRPAALGTANLDPISAAHRDPTIRCSRSEERFPQ